MPDIEWSDHLIIDFPSSPVAVLLAKRIQRRRVLLRRTEEEMEWFRREQASRKDIISRLTKAVAEINRMTTRQDIGMDHLMELEAQLVEHMKKQLEAERVVADLRTLSSKLDVLAMTHPGLGTCSACERNRRAMD